MATTRYKEGAVTVTVTHDLERWLRSVVEASTAGLLDALETPAEKVAADARAVWYQQVDKQSGASGDISVQTTISPTEVRVSIVSAAPYAKYVHRPGPLSTETRRATDAEFAANLRAGVKRPAAYYKRVVNPKASDGKYLLQELIGKPFRAAIKALPAHAKAAIYRRINRG